MIKKILEKPTLLNTISGIVLQLCNILYAFIIPKITLSYFGSEVNGLVSSINNFLLYISLAEAGLSNVIMANLYKPLVERDYDKINKIVNTATAFYHKIGYFFILYTIILGLIYPVLFKVAFSKTYVFLLVIIMSINLFIQYNFSYSFRTLLRADKKGYIVNFTQIIIIILNIFVSLISLIIYPKIHFFKFVSGIVYILQPIIFAHFIKKYYGTSKDDGKDNQLLRSRWDSLAISVATFVHNSVDIALLTLFTNLKVVSVYSVYYLVISGLEAIMLSIANSIAPTFGKLYANKNVDKLNKKFETYEFVYTALIFIIFSIAGLLITPFVIIYTSNINDANYYQPLFGYLIIISEAIYLLKMPHLYLSYSANLFKKITKSAYIEALINIIVSLILVPFCGLIGVAIGTLIAMLFRTIFQIRLLKKNILLRKPIIFWKKVLIFSLAMLIGLTLCSIIGMNFEYNVLNWIIHAIIYSFIMVTTYVVFSIIFYKNQLKEIILYFKD